MAASILIADDDAVARRLVENMVQKCGYEALVAESGDAVLVDRSGHGYARILTVPPALLGTAATLCQQVGLLTNDALIVAVMQVNGLTKLASHDADFDRVPGLTRYAPA